jgi:hypothetical protein
MTVQSTARMLTGMHFPNQITLGPLPASLPGRGTVNIALTADGFVPNTFPVSFR